jgi:hypothetical protein
MKRILDKLDVKVMGWQHSQIERLIWWLANHPAIVVIIVLQSVIIFCLWVDMYKHKKIWIRFRGKDEHKQG